jgi:hypothetical protein
MIIIVNIKNGKFFLISLFKFLKKSVINITDNTDLMLPIENNLAEVNKQMALEMRNKLVESYVNPSVRLS